MSSASSLPVFSPVSTLITNMRFTLLVATLAATPGLWALGTLQSVSYVFSGNGSTVFIQLPDTQKSTLVYYVNGERTEIYPTGAGDLTIKYTDAPWVRFDKIDSLDYVSISVAMSDPAFRQENEGFPWSIKAHYKILDFGLGLRMTMITKLEAKKYTTSEIKIFPSGKAFDSFSAAFDEIVLQRKALLHQQELDRQRVAAKPALPDPFELPVPQTPAEVLKP